ncbi:uncharacterized protein [Typha latifolia]|uniref:uncharacterized protein n=1 Tax=Typha latifolia TaxID=4733 RepID=UPI003C2EA871
MATTTTTTSSSSSPHIISTTTTISPSNPVPRRSSSSNSSSSSSSSTSQTTTQACAVCKYQRRKCNPDCPLAPYFPADQQRQFLNAHRLFGVRNILNIIKPLEPVQRAEAMRSIIFQSNARAYDPVGGCYRIILELERQLELGYAELAYVQHQLSICRSQAHAALNPGGASDLDSTSSALLLASSDDVVVDAMYSDQQTNPVLPLHDNPQQQQQYYDYFYYQGTDGDDANNNNNNNNNNCNSDNNSINNNNDNCNNIGMDIEASDSSMLGLQLQQHCKVEEEDDMKPLVDVFEVRQALEMGDDDDEQSKNAGAPVESLHCRLGLGFSSF